MTGGETDSDRPTLVIAGASTAVGRLLPDCVDDSIDIIGLIPPSTDRETLPEYEALELRTYNPFSLEETVAACEGADWALNVARHFRPEGQWIQGSDGSLDLLRAANLAAAADTHGVRGLVLLASGLEVSTPDASRDLGALLEVYEAADTPSTALVADGLIGPKAPLEGVVRSVADRRPRRSPAWSRRERSIVAVGDAADAAAEYVGEPVDGDRRILLVPPERTSFCNLVQRVLGDEDRSADVQKVAGDWPRLSAWWLGRSPTTSTLRMSAVVELFRTGAADTLSDLDPRPVPTDAREALDPAREAERLPAEISSTDSSLARRRSRSSVVYSLQRLPSPTDMSAKEVADEYFRWLQQTVHWVLRVERDGGHVQMYPRGTRIPLLILQKVDRPESAGGASFRIAGGRLAEADGSAYFEFRSLQRTGETLVALRNYRTVFPWLLYRWTQGVVHGWVMRRFGKHLAGLRTEV